MFYDNLPGINVTLKDGGLIIPENGDSESILIIAPSLAKDAPEEPVLVRSSNELVQYGFGDFYVNGDVNPIAAEWKAAADAGARIIYLAALKEITAEMAAELEANAIADAVAKGATQVEAEAKFSTVLTGSTEQHGLRRTFVHFYEQLMSNLLDFTVDHVVVKGATIEDQVTDLTGAFFPEVHNVEEFPAIGGFITSSYVVESDFLDFPAVFEELTSDTLALRVGGADVTLTIPAKSYDGQNLSLNDLAVDLQAVVDASALKAKVRADNGKIALHFAEPASVLPATTAAALKVDAKVAVWRKTPQGVIVRGSFAQTIADFCATKTLMKASAIGYIGTKSPVDAKVSTIRKHVDNLMKIDTEISPFLQVVGSEVGVNLPNTNALHYVNGATHYAATIASLRKEGAPTNKQVLGVKAIRFDYSLRQLSRLTSKKIVTFRLKDATQLVVTDGITTAPSIMVGGKLRDSDYTRLSTLRITQLAIEVVREAVEPFVGSSNEMPQYNALNTAIKSALEKIREVGAIQGYNFRIVNAAGRLDEATILLEVVPAFELRRINIQVSLAPSEAMLASFNQ